ncbi:MAG: Bis(5'-nucleosyl)-tetraphosphatase, symmetrical (EC [uncultured Sulfurovum sp.]|uniref:bis(5'-nucleosyl)-tetraphosphatase (symmetrical) n=1 Tax=uncultured Sulfurovum sp. TaxID=269237 RepID=A0A6S6SDS5_9BACT|nr:MAG: Bis(5'-nucleosyl)-tetraphosphatase, symmetrical (EC [uncultured Sulfurovum sp.]
MAVWAIGDIQGCFDAFQALLKKINFNPKVDELWVAGDLVNRGDKSLETLNYLYSIKDSVKIVLGNHDIALIAAYVGVKKSNETIQPILEAKNADTLIEWLRHQPFFHWDFKLGYCMAHAGISPQFDFGMAITHALRIEKKLQGSNYKAWLQHMFRINANKFSSKASSMDIDKYILSAFTAMRFCEDDGRLDFKQKGKPTEYKVVKKGLKPWFACPTRRSTTLKVVFGHWSTLGYYQDSNVLALDTGCLWGGALTVARLDQKEAVIVQFPCKKQQNP